MSYDVTATQGHPLHLARLQTVMLCPSSCFPGLKKKKNTVTLWDLVDGFLSLLTSVALEFCPLQVSRDCLNGVRLQMFIVMIMDVTSCHLELAWTGTKQLALWECHEPASFPISACGLCSLSSACSLLLLWEATHWGSASSSAAFAFPGPFCHGSFKASSEGLWDCLLKVLCPTCLTFL